MSNKNSFIIIEKSFSLQEIAQVIFYIQKWNIC